MGEAYQRGERTWPRVAKDDLKALDCWIRAVELGSPEACVKIGICYAKVNGVAVNKARVVLFERVGALRGSAVAHNNIGWSEYNDFGNNEIAIRHRKIAAEAGFQPSLRKLRKIYNAQSKMSGKQLIGKEYLESIYRACHEAQMEVKSEERESHREKRSGT